MARIKGYEIRDACAIRVTAFPDYAGASFGLRLPSPQKANRMDTDFFSPRHGIIVTRLADSSISWSGRYKGMAIHSAIPLENNRRCIILLNPDSSFRQVFENLLCIDQDGKTPWIAKLPGIPDRFLDVQLTPAGIEAYTFSGFMVLIDPRSGAEVKRVFTK